MGLNPRWVFLALIDVGVAPAKLLELYDRLFKSRVCDIVLVTKIAEKNVFHIV